MTGNWRELLAQRGIKVHPAADLFPMIADEELESLAKDIAENGIRQGVVLWTSTRMPVQTAAAARGALLLDGRNRLAAAVLAYRSDPDRLAEMLDDALYVNPENSARLIGGEIDPWDFVVSANICRRHLSVDDRRRIAEELLRQRPQRSDRDIGRQVRLDHKTIGGLRAEQERRGEIPHVPNRTDSVGRQQPATRPPQLGKEAQIRALREQQAAATAPAPPAAAAARLRSTLATLAGMIGPATAIDLAAARKGLTPDDLADDRDRVRRCLDWLRKVEAALL